MTEPLVSVVIPNYNHAAFVSRAIRAVLNQSYRNLELIVIDDASTDNSVEIIQSALQNDSRATLHRNAKNVGHVESSRIGEDIAEGDYLYFGAADDMILGGFFEKCIPLMEQHPHAGLCCGEPVWIREQTGEGYIGVMGWSDQPRYFSPVELADAMCGGFIAGHATIFRRSMFLQSSVPAILRGQLRWHCDWFLNLVIAFRHGVCYVPEPIAVMREAATTYSASGRKNWEMQKEVLFHLLKVLRSEAYRDLMPLFARASILSHFNQNCEIVRVVFEHPELWDATTLMLIQDPLWDWSAKMRQVQSNRIQVANQSRKQVSLHGWQT